jgi:hypothetical protein
MHRDGIESDFEANRPATEGYGERDSGIIRERLEELYGLINTEEYKHPKIQKEIKDLEKAMGDAPAIGSGGRYA